MATTLLRLVADLNNSLAAAASVGATTATLSSPNDSEGVALPSGKYGLTIDGDNSAKEFIVCDLVGTALTGVFSISNQGAATSGFANYHRVGAVVTVTDWAILSRVLNNLTGVTGFDAGNPLNYDSEPDYSDPLTIPTVQYVLDTVNGGPVSFNAIVIAGDAGENVADGDWVYYNTTDGEWYLTDADDTTKCLNVQIGKARGAGTNGTAIVGGIFIAGLETVGTYIAGTTYYLGNTAGALATSAGTNSVVVGVGDANGDLILRKATPSQTDAMVGDVPPTSINRFLTKGKQMVAGATITGATLPVPVYQNKTDNEFYACDANDTAAMKFIGFAITNGTDGAAMNVQFSGIVSGFTGLAEGEKYYVQDTVGTIGTTIGTYEILVGVAISETELLIQKGNRYAAGTYNVVDAGGAGTNQVASLVVGFRPSTVRMFLSYIEGGTDYQTGAMVYANGASYALGVNDWTDFQVVSVTDTGFGIQVQQVPASPDAATVIWEAEGDF